MTTFLGVLCAVLFAVLIFTIVYYGSVASVAKDDLKELKWKYKDVVPKYILRNKNEKLIKFIRNVFSCSKEEATLLCLREGLVDKNHLWIENLDEDCY